MDLKDITNYIIRPKPEVMPLPLFLYVVLMDPGGEEGEQRDANLCRRARLRQ